MKNSRYYPYERNRYFYGKLLTVRDFESEQKYMNDKRRLINRLLFGSGVVCGLKVVAVDNKTISMEAGVALDCSGREIVVASPVTQKLSMVEGFTNNEYSKNVYLCIAYDEKGKEPVHSVASSSGGTEEVSEYNRFNEGYKLIIREDNPDPSTFGYSYLAEENHLVYQDSQVKVWQKTPRYVNPGDTFELKIKVEKTIQTPRLELEYEIVSDHFYTVDGGTTLKISFTEPDYGQEISYESGYLLKAGDMKNTTGSIRLKENSFRIKIGDKELNAAQDCINNVQIIDGPVKDEIIQSYFNLTLEQCVECAPEQYVYLAKISLLHMGPTFIIEKVENKPFGEYVYNTSLLYRLGLLDQGQREVEFSTRASATELEEDEKPQAFVNYNRDNNRFDFQLGIPRSKVMIESINTGTVDVELERNPKVGKSYFSEEIEHGLGPGPVFIITGLEEATEDDTNDINQSGGMLLFGNQDVFHKSPYESNLPSASVGSILYPMVGRFRTGIQLHYGTKLTKIRVRWWAYRKLPD